MSKDQLHAYFDRELGPDEAAQFERDAAADPALEAQLKSLREIDDALGCLPGHDAPPGFTERVVTASRRRTGWILRLAVPLAAAAVVLVAVLLHGSSPDGSGAAAAAEVADYSWEIDTETFDSLSLGDVEEQILEELEAT